MSFTDIMSGANLSWYAQVALVLFLLAFVAIVIRTCAPSRRGELDAAARIPFDDDQSVASHSGER